MKHFPWMNLQLFAEGGNGADGGSAGNATGGGYSTPGVEADPGRQRLLALGVPEDKIRNRAKKAEAQLPAGAVKTTPASEAAQKPQEQVAAVQNEPTEEKDNQEQPAAKPTWDELMKDPDYNKQMQSVVNNRLRTAKQAEENLSALAPALEIFIKKYGLDPEKLDHKALAEKIRADDSLFAEKAVEMGVDSSMARRVELADMDADRARRIQEMTMRQQFLLQHRQKLEQQAPALKSVFPGFDLDTELQNPTFARLTGPGVNMSLEDAYHAVHRKEIEAARASAMAQQVAQQVSQSIQSGARRPAEAGTSGSAPSVTSFDYKKATPAQREVLKQRIREAAARGEKLYPGR